MIGNDIVDLQCAKNESDWHRAGFLDKVFDENEKNYLRNASDPNTLVWRMWTMKESAYKANVRRSSKRFFNPKRISCTLLDPRTGSVSIGAMKYLTLTETNSKYIYTVALAHSTTEVESSCFSLKEDTYSGQHRETYETLIKKLAIELGLAKNSIHIKKDRAGIPLVYVKNQLLKRHLTMTHHGHFAAFALTNYAL